ncbi:hypothetical protein [Planctomyces sp. SH-PL62]|uniref:DUF3024 domain-containing protein n=1 Tax=Planctomyces sp. SH-PL62 TaxID=1636152 RepID=UPI00078D8B70|nr:hypothetical protein [Planctomyces sp. SH-PL62]AMV39801.1 hypothetical protein VT85_20385 [Planctomyces sp. SH-PL62]
MKSSKSGGRKSSGSGKGQGGAVAAPRPVILDFVQNRIAAYDGMMGGGVGVRKDRHGYTLFREDCGEPLARLRPQADGRFAVLYWNVFNERWRSVGDFGDVVLTLDDALEYIAKDPMDCFWR